MAVSPKVKHRAPFCPAIPLPSTYSRKCVHTQICMQIFIAALYKPKTINDLNVHQPVNRKHVNIYTMEYYSATKKEELLTHDTPWIELKTSMLSKRSRTQETTYGMIPLRYEGSRKGECVRRVDE